MPVPRAAPPAIALDRVTLGYDGRPVLRDITIELEPGSLTALIGPNGGGKSTLLKALAGEIAPLGGTVSPIPRSTVAYLPQSPDFDRSFPILTRDVVAMGLWRRLGPFGHIGRPQAAAVQSALAAVGLPGFGARPVGSLSGGELQRALFARLSLLDASIILLDEPLAAVDRDAIAVLVGIIGRWHAEGRTVVAALHDLDQVRSVFPRTIRLAGGRAIAGPTAEMLGALGVAAELPSPAAGAVA